jgi:hypothetical protein
MLRAIILWVLVLPLVHWVVAIYFRSLRREALERDYDNGGETGTREDFIAAGMAAYEGSLRARIVVLVYIIPILAVVAIAWAVNAN